MCVFCKIIEGEIPSTKIYEDENILAIKDINPMAPVHVVIFPKKHIESTMLLNGENSELVAKIFAKIPEIAKACEIDKSGFRVINNCGEDGCQSVPHIHFHLLGGKKLPEKIV